MIPVNDVRPGLMEIKPELDAATERVHAGGRYILGAEVDAFEREFAAYCGVPHCVGVACGLDALVLLLRADGIGPGDEVIVPAYTFVATWLAVTLTGARPVGADVDPATYLLDPAAAEAAITERTRALLPVHLFGRVADMEALGAVAARHGLALYEDAAQAHGARFQGRTAGGLGRAAAFSFYPTKNLGAFGDGGAVTTADDALADRVRLLRSYGWRQRDDPEVIGVNSRLDEIQAAWLRVKLGHLDAWNDRRREIAGAFRSRLSAVETPPPDDGCVWYAFAAAADDRDALAARLRQRGVGTLVHYHPLPHLTQPYRAEGWREGDFPVAERLAGRQLSLPMYPQLTADEVERVIAAVEG